MFVKSTLLSFICFTSQGFRLSGPVEFQYQPNSQSRASCIRHVGLSPLRASTYSGKHEAQKVRETIELLVCDSNQRYRCCSVRGQEAP